MSKPTILYGETYNKGTVLENQQEVIEKIQRKGTIIYAKSHNSMSDETQELTITIKFPNKK